MLFPPLCGCEPGFRLEGPEEGIVVGKTGLLGNPGQVFLREAQHLLLCVANAVGRHEARERHPQPAIQGSRYIGGVGKQQDAQRDKQGFFHGYRV